MALILVFEANSSGNAILCLVHLSGAKTYAKQSASREAFAGRPSATMGTA